MENIKKDTKKQKQIGFYDDEIKSISYLAKSYKNDFSSTVRELVLRGMDNINTAENLKDDIKFLISKLERQIEKLENKIEEKDKKNSKINMHILKYAAKNNSLAKTFESKKSGMTPEDFKVFVDRVETNSVKNMFVKIKEVEEKEDELI